ncbi:MAG: prepilin-type N-terminal cleavage/methylation domain-containing protein [Candidatus Gracilibacteria bacterium]|jgi:prepilin-type N-terminal cleavage/methylation domain-containing protein
MKQKNNKNQKGFTLVEVLLGITILTVAIVLATNMFLSAMKSNRIMTLNLKAYYLAQEGLEIVRNIRDTHWMHNLDWMSGSGLAGDPTILEKGIAGNPEVYSVNFYDGVSSESKDIQNINELLPYLPWEIKNVPGTDFYNDDFKVDESAGHQFYRHVNILPYKDKDDFVLIQSVVNFEDGGNDNSVVLEEVLTNWKKGIL